nr:mucin-2 protein [Nocardioides sp. MAH-18]
MPRAATVAAPLALVATAAVVAIGVAASNPDPGTLLAEDAASISGSLDRDSVVSRSALDSRAERRQLQAAVDRNAKKTATMLAVRRADTRLWTTAPLNLWAAPSEDAKRLGELAEGKRVLVTGRKMADRTEVVVDGEPRWVTAGYLSDEKPVAAAAGLSMQPCPDPSVESGLTDNAVYVYRSVCHAFPQITSYGGWDGHGEHSSGRALDIMTSDVELGDAIAAFLQQHAGELNLYDILWRQRIWTPERAGEGWRGMSSRGSATANHYDHVHVATY